MSSERPVNTDTENRGGGNYMQGGSLFTGFAENDQQAGAESVEDGDGERKTNPRKAITDIRPYTDERLLTPTREDGYQRNPSKLGVHIGNWGGAHRHNQRLPNQRLHGQRPSKLHDLGLT